MYRNVFLAKKHTAVHNTAVHHYRLLVPGNSHSKNLNKKKNKTGLLRPLLEFFTAVCCLCFLVLALLCCEFLFVIFVF